MFEATVLQDLSTFFFSEIYFNHCALTCPAVSNGNIDAFRCSTISKGAKVDPGNQLADPMRHP